MAPGYLHFDVRRGLSVDVLNAAVAALLADHASIKKALDSLLIDGLSYVLVDHREASIVGHQLHFLRHGQRLDPQSKKSTFADDIFANPISLNELEQWLAAKCLSPSVGALVKRILEQLSVQVFEEQVLARNDAMWLVCHVVSFCALIDALDPKFITTTKICIGENALHASRGETLSFTDSLWLNHVMMGMAMIEVRDDIVVDVIALACIKALAGHVGARGESRILKVGLGINAGSAKLLPVVVEALWCEPNLPESMTETGLGTYARLDSVYEIAGVVPAHTDVVQLASSLTLHGGMSLTWHHAQREKNQSCYVMRFLVKSDDKRDAVEAFLIKGGAFDVTVSVVERHELSKRLVSVPIGTGNKATSARFFEYLYLDKTVRVEPIKEDLDLYVKRTDYSVDVARSDLLLAWKKWRGRVVSEDA